MHKNLTDSDRQAFFRKVLDDAGKRGAIACVVIEDANRGMATKQVETHELDVTLLALERADIEFGRRNEKGMVVVDRPGGGPKDEDVFLASCVDALQEGTDYWKKAHTAFVVSSRSKFLTACSSSLMSSSVPRSHT